MCSRCQENQQIERRAAKKPREDDRDVKPAADTAYTLTAEDAASHQKNQTPKHFYFVGISRIEPPAYNGVVSPRLLKPP
jgi:hypothetical protein